MNSFTKQAKHFGGRSGGARIREEIADTGLFPVWFWPCIEYEPNDRFFTFRKYFHFSACLLKMFLSISNTCKTKRHSILPELTVNSAVKDFQKKTTPKSPTRTEARHTTVVTTRKNFVARMLRTLICNKRMRSFFCANQSGFRLSAVGRLPIAVYKFTGRAVAVGSNKN